MDTKYLSVKETCLGGLKGRVKGKGGPVNLDGWLIKRMTICFFIDWIYLVLQNILKSPFLENTTYIQSDHLLSNRQRKQMNCLSQLQVFLKNLRCTDCAKHRFCHCAVSGCKRYGVWDLKTLKVQRNKLGTETKSKWTVTLHG